MNKEPEFNFVVEDLKTNVQRVEWILEEFPETRDSNEKLQTVYAVKFANIPQWSLANYLAVYEELNPESITRARRKVQQENPELRGESAKLRAVNEEAVKEWAVE